MADTATIAASGRDYVGNAALGGGGELAINLDTRPIQQLAQYTFLYNKSQYDQRQKDADQKIDEISKLMDYNLVNALPKDRDELINAQAALTDYLAKYASKPTPNSPKEKIQQEVELQTNIIDHIKKINGAGARLIGYTARKNAIMQSIDNAASKEEQIKQLDKEVNDTDIYTKIQALPKYKVENIEVPKPIPTKFDTVAIGDNQNFETTSTIFVPSINVPEADRAQLGIKKLYPKKGTPEYNNLSAIEKNQSDIQATVESSGKFWGDMTDVLNSQLLKKDANGKLLYVNDEGNFLSKKFENYYATNTPIMTAYNGAKLVSNYSKKKFDELSTQNGIFDDKGVQYKLPGNLTANDFRAGIIDFSKGVNSTQLGLAGMYGEYGGDTFDKKVTQTNAANNKLNTLLDYKVAWKNAETARINALKPNDNQPKPEAVISQPAILFGEHINRLKTEFSKNKGTEIIVPFRSVDEKTRVATKLKEGQFIIYNPNGSYIITTDEDYVKDNKKGKLAKLDETKTVSVGTIDNLAQGFIDAVKTIDLDATKDKDGTMAEGFQVKSEAFFNQTFGTASGKIIWDNWGKPKTATTTQTIPNTDSFEVNGKTYTKKELNDLGYTDDRLNEAINLKLIKVKKQ